MTSPVGDKPSLLPRFDDPMKAMVGALSTIVLLVVVDILWAMEKLLFGQSEVPGVGINVFNLGALVISLWFYALANSGKLGALFALLARATRTGMTSDTDVVDGRDVNAGRFQRNIMNLWIPVTLQFLLAAWLIYVSGGIMNSPFSSVLIGMMLIGQSVYLTPQVELGADAKMLDVLVFVGRLARAYCYPLLMLIFLLVGLIVMQEHYPLVKKPASPAVTVLTTLLSLFVSMCVVFVTRRVDQTTRKR